MKFASRSRSMNSAQAPRTARSMRPGKVVLSVFLLAVALPLTAAISAKPDRIADPSAALASTIARSEELFLQERYDVARKLLEDLLPQYPNEAEILWRLAQHAINDGDGTTDSKAQERYFRDAVRYAEAAVRADGRNANAWAYLAASHGSYAMFAGGKEKVKLANRIRDELDRALELDPRNEVAHTIYGTWHREVAEVGWIERQLANMFLGSMPDGSIEASIRHFQAAIRQGPDVLRHHFELGLTYIADDREKEAAAAFRIAQKCPNGWKSDNLRRSIMKKWLRENG